MSNEIHVTVRGNATSDATLRYTSAGAPWVTFRIGSSARRFDQGTGQWTDGETQWFNVKSFGRSAEYIGGSVRKGTPVLVRGTLTSETWTDDQGQERSSMVITGDSVALEMSRGLTTYTRVEPVREQAATDAAPGTGDEDDDESAELDALTDRSSVLA